MKSIKPQPFSFILLTTVAGAFIIEKLFLFMIKPYAQEMSMKLTTPNYRGEISLTDISVLMTVLNLRFFIALTLSSFLIFLFY